MLPKSNFFTEMGLHAAALLLKNAESEENNGTTESMENKEHFEIKCGSRCFHQYRKFWTPKLNEKLEVVRERGNVYDPYAMALSIKTRKTIDGHRVIGHLPREISRFSKFFYDYGGKMEAYVSNIAFRRSPIPQGGLEIPIVLKIFKSKAQDIIFNTMKEKVNFYYTARAHFVIDQSADLFT